MYLSEPEKLNPYQTPEWIFSQITQIHAQREKQTVRGEVFSVRLTVFFPFFFFSFINSALLSKSRVYKVLSKQEKIINLEKVGKLKTHSK